MNVFLAKCRFLMIVPVVGCLACSLVMVLFGIWDIFVHAANLLRSSSDTENISKLAILGVIEVIDVFLVATVSYITALGLYKLFISSSDFEMPMRLRIHNLADLENKIIGVIVAALSVAFLGIATGDYDFQTISQFGIGVSMIIAALGLFVFLTSGKSTKTDQPDDLPGQPGK